jgi:DNA helicase-2/ATP-dependent DNA helicase PcrA
MDFDDLLVNMIHLLKSSPEMLENIQSIFTHICVDEYQDTNRAQYEVVKMLSAVHHNICVVGDDAQSIYRWRGADIRNILDFQKDYPKAKVVRLEQNYRSTKNILSAADAVIRNNRNQLPKELWTDNEEGNKIHVYANRDDREEAERVANAIELECSGYQTSYKDVAILYRTNAQSQALEDALRRKGIPYTIISGISFYKRKEVKDVAAYLRLLINPQDTESLLRIVNEPPRGIGDTSMQRLRSYSEDKQISLLEAFRRSEEIEALTKRSKKAAQDFAELVLRHAASVGVKAPDDVAREYIDATGLLRMYEAQHTDEAEDRANNVIRLLTDISEYTLREEEPSLEAYLQQLSLVSDVDEADTTQNRVSVMTLHAAKGWSIRQ